MAVMPDVDARARKRGSRWEGQFRFGGYWFLVKRHERILTYPSADAARAAAARAKPLIAKTALTTQAELA